MWQEYQQVKRIEFYSGMKADESPRRISTEEGEIFVKRVIEQGRTMDKTGEMGMFFVFEDTEERIFKLISKGGVWQIFLWS